MNDHSHLAPAALVQLDLSDAERMRAIFSEHFVHHARVDSILAQCDYLVSRPIGLRPRGLLISGRSGSGKTLLGEAIARRYAPTDAARGQPATQPVLVISMSGAREAKELHTRMLEALKCPHINRMTGGERRSSALNLARAAKIKLLLVDELQDVLHTTARQQALLLVTIKDTMNSLLVPTIALGTPDAAVALEADQHLKARFRFRELMPWKADDYLREFLDALEKCMPLKRRSNLGSLCMMRHIVKATEGLTYEIVQRLQTAAALAMLTGEERITEALFDRAETEFPPL